MSRERVARSSLPDDGYRPERSSDRFSMRAREDSLWMVLEGEVKGKTKSHGFGM